MPHEPARDVLHEELRTAGRRVRVQEILGPQRGGRVRVALLRLAPAPSCAAPTSPAASWASPRLRQRHPARPGAPAAIASSSSSVPSGQLATAEPIAASTESGSLRTSDSKAVARLVGLVLLVEPLGLSQRARLRVVAVDHGELERRPLVRVGLRAHAPKRGVVALRKREHHDGRDGHDGDRGDDRNDTRARGHNCARA